MALAEEKERPEVEGEAQHPAAPEPPKVTEDEDGGVTVSMPQPPERPSRRERRAEHAQGRDNEELRRYREEADSLRNQVRIMEMQLAQRLAGVEQRISQPAQPTYAEQVRTIRAQQETIQQHLRSGAVTSEAEAERLRRQFYALDDQVDELREAKIKRAAVEEFQRANQRPPGDYEETILRGEYPEVVNHPQAMRWANGRYHQLVAEGKPANLVTSRAALDEAAARFQLRQAPPPQASEAQKQRYGAVAAQAGAKNTGEGIRLDKDQKRMAIARWPRDDEHVAYAKMAVLLRKLNDAGTPSGEPD